MGEGQWGWGSGGEGEIRGCMVEEQVWLKGLRFQWQA